MASTQVLAGFHAVIARLRQAPDSVREIYVEAARRDKRMVSLIDQATTLYDFKNALRWNDLYYHSTGLRGW